MTFARCAKEARCAREALAMPLSSTSVTDVINGPGVLLAAVLGEQARYIADSMKTVGSVDPSVETGLALHLVI